MFSGQRIVAAGQRCKEFVIEKALTELPMNAFTSYLPRLKLIFRQRVALVPGVPAEVLAGLRMLVARHGARRQIRYGGSSGACERCERRLIARELSGIEQSADELIVGVGREAIVAIKTAG